MTCVTLAFDAAVVLPNWAQNAAGTLTQMAKRRVRSVQWCGATPGGARFDEGGKAVGRLGPMGWWH